MAGDAGQPFLGAQDMADLHQVVVGYYGQMVGGKAIGFEQDEIVEEVVLPLDFVADQVVQAGKTGVGGSEADYGRSPGGFQAAAFRSGQGAATAVVAEMGRFGAFLFRAEGEEPFDGAVATVGVALGNQAFRVFVVDGEAFRLEVGAEIAADPGAFVPINIQPIQAVEDAGDGAGDEALLVGVLDADDEAAAAMPGKEPVEKGGADVADMGVAGRAGGIADADVGGHQDAPCWSEAAAMRAQVSRKDAVRLKTGALGRESTGSAQK